MKSIKTTKPVSLEEALRNLASTMTGTPVNELPLSLEAIVQYMAEHVTPADSAVALAAPVAAILKEDKDFISSVAEKK